MNITATSITSLYGEKIRLSFDVLFVSVPFIEPEILPFYQCGGSPLVSILKWWTKLKILIIESISPISEGLDAVCLNFDK